MHPDTMTIYASSFDITKFVFNFITLHIFFHLKMIRTLLVTIFKARITQAA